MKPIDESHTVTFDNTDASQLPVPTTEELIQCFEELAWLLEFQGENPFKIKAYKNAVSIVEDWDQPLAQLTPDQLEGIPGIGKELKAKILAFQATGKIEAHQRLLKEIPPGLLDLASLPGLGPKKVRLLFDQLNVSSLSDLEAAIQSHKIQTLKGFTAKTEASLLEALQKIKVHHKFRRLVVGDREAQNILQHVTNFPLVERVAVAGEIRRRCEIVQEIVLVCALKTVHPSPEELNAWKTHCDALPQLQSNRSHWDENHHLYIGQLTCGLPLRIVLTPLTRWGSQLCLETGPQQFTHWLTQHSGVLPPASEESTVFETLNRPWCPPELRDWDSPETIPDGNRLITAQDLLGDLHMHTTDSDGRNSLFEMAEAALSKGLSYIAVTNHSVSQYQANGLDVKRFEAHLKAIESVQLEFPALTILKGAEVDILTDGRLDLPDDLLGQMDVVVASVHNQLHLNPDKMTQRLLAALENPLIHIIGHPTGRLLLEREPSPYDWDILFPAIKVAGVCLEINATPARMDLSDSMIRQAKRYGISFTLSTDAHHRTQLHNTPYGLAMARRAGLSPSDIINTLPLHDLRHWLQNKKHKSPYPVS